MGGATIYLHTYIYIYIYIYLYINICKYNYIYIYVCMYLYTYTTHITYSKYDARKSGALPKCFPQELAGFGLIWDISSNKYSSARVPVNRAHTNAHTNSRYALRKTPISSVYRTVWGTFQLHYILINSAARPLARSASCRTLAGSPGSVSPSASRLSLLIHYNRTCNSIGRSVEMDDRLGHLPAGKPNAAPPDSLVTSAQISGAAFLSPDAQLFFSQLENFQSQETGPGALSMTGNWLITLTSVSIYGH